MKPLIKKTLKVGTKEFMYILFMGIAAILGYVRIMLFGRYLSPEAMGYYSIVLTIAAYGVFLQLGLMSGLNRELPVCLGRDKGKYSSFLVGEITMSVVLLQLVGTIIYYIVLLNIKFHDPSVKAAFFMAGLLAFSVPFNQMVMLRLRSERRVLEFSLLQMVNSFVVLFGGLLAIKYLGYKGAILAMISFNIASFLLASAFFLTPVKYFAPIRLKDIGYLMRIGLPMMIAGVFLTLQMSMDRLFLIKEATPSQIGIYQIGLLPLMLGVVGSGIVNQYIGPKLLFGYGQNKSIKYVFSRAAAVAVLIIVGMLLLWPAVKPVTSFVIGKWLPAYRESIPLIVVFYLGAIFTTANIMGVTINAANRQVLCLWASILMVIICFLGYSVVAIKGFPLICYAYTNAAAQIVNFLLMLGISYFLVRKTEKDNYYNLTKETSEREEEDAIK